jgi:hypothetical protein
MLHSACLVARGILNPKLFSKQGASASVCDPHSRDMRVDEGYMRALTHDKVRYNSVRSAYIRA